MSFNMLMLVSYVADALGSNEHHVNWHKAREDCNAKFTSYLMPERYMVKQNLTDDIVKGIGINTSAWIDGNIQEIGCSPGDDHTISFLI
jgi:hypothetical protein